MQADLQCPSPGPAIELGQRARLQLNAHSFRGPGRDGPSATAVFCQGRCTVEGPGEISDFTMGVFALAAGSRVDVSDLTLRDNGPGVTGRVVYLTRTIVIGSRQWAVSGQHVVRLQDVDISGTTLGPFSVGAGTLRGENLTCTGNAGAGVSARHFSLTGFVATGNGGPGIESLSGTGKIVGGVITGNGGGLVDLATRRRPRLVATSCDHSSNGEGGTWNVCRLD